MGYVYAAISLKNPRYPEIDSVSVNALVDSACWLVCIPQALSDQLRFEEIDRRPVKLANGTIVSVPYVGPLQTQFDGRQAFTGALVMGDEVLLGAVAMEDMNVSLHARQQILVTNPGPWPGIVGGVRPAQ